MTLFLRTEEDSILLKTPSLKNGEYIIWRECVMIVWWPWYFYLMLTFSQKEPLIRTLTTNNDEWVRYFCPGRIYQMLWFEPFNIVKINGTTVKVFEALWVRCGSLGWFNDLFIYLRYKTNFKFIVNLSWLYNMLLKLNGSPRSEGVQINGSPKNDEVNEWFTPM